MRTRSSKLTFRFLLVITLMLFAPIIIIITSISSNYYSYLSNLTQQEMRDMAENQASLLNDEIQSIRILVGALNYNTEFLDTISEYNSSNDPESQYQLQLSIDDQLANVFNYTNRIGYVAVFLDDKPPYRFQNYPIIKDVSIDQKTLNTINAQLIEYSDIVYIDDNLFSLSSLSRSGVEEPLLTVLVRPNESRSGDAVRMIMVGFRVSFFRSVYYESSESAFSYITDNENDLLLSSTSHNLALEILKQEGPAPQDGSIVQDGRWLIASQKVPASDWHVHYVVDAAQLYGPLNRIRRLVFLALAAVFLLLVLYIAYFLHDLITPVNHIINEMASVEAGNYKVRAQPAGPVEMRHLIEGFNSMVAKVEVLTEERAIREQERGRLELEALQHQINPHFIANTLNSIRIMASLKKDENITEMTASLIGLVNSSYRSSGNMTTLSEEISTLKDYVHIMKVRFGNRIQIHFKIPEELKKYQLLKMLIQPLVENAIIHGLSQHSGRGIINVSAVEKVNKQDEPMLVITVRDNGKGVEWDKLESEFPASEASKGSFSSIGLKNIHRRIHLNSNENYGLSINSTIGEFTEAVLVLPVQPIAVRNEDIQ